MTLSQRRVVQAIVGCVIVFSVAAYLAVRFGGDLKTTLLGIIGTALTPTIGALITLLIVTPLRNQQAQNGEAIARVEKKVNGQMDALRATAQEAARVAADAVQANAVTTARALALAEESKRRELAATSEVEILRERLRQLGKEGPP